MTEQRYIRAVERNISELYLAILERTTLKGLEEAIKSGASHTFLHIIYVATFNDYISHCIKVFDPHKDAASFWYIYNNIGNNGLDREKICKNIDIDALEKVKQQLTVIRDKTHFHIDRKGVISPKSIWDAAGLSGKKLSQAVNVAWDMFSSIQKMLNIQELSFPVNYNSKTVKDIAILVDAPPHTREPRTRCFKKTRPARKVRAISPGLRSDSAARRARNLGRR